MEELISELMQNGREDLLIVGMAVAIVLLLVQLHKINKANKKIDAVVKSVEDYLRVILEEDDADSKDTAGQAQRVREGAQSWLKALEQEYDRLRTETETTVAHAAAQMDRAGEALDQISRLMDRQAGQLEQLEQICGQQPGTNETDRE